MKKLSSHSYAAMNTVPLTTLPLLADGPMSEALEVAIGQWKQPSGSYDPQNMVQLADIITNFQLHGRRARELLYAFLSLLTGLPTSTLSSALLLPSHTIQQPQEQQQQQVAGGLVLQTGAGAGLSWPVRQCTLMPLSYNHSSNDSASSINSESESDYGRGNGDD